MKNYLITFHDPERPQGLGQISDFLHENFDFWGAEFDAGLFFISSDLIADEIAHQLREFLEPDLITSAFVFELSNNWEMVSGTTKVNRAIAQHQPQAPQ